MEESPVEYMVEPSNETETYSGEGLAKDGINVSPAIKLPPDWAVIEKLAIAGMSPAQLATRFEVTSNAIRVRACKEKWPVSNKPGRVPSEMKAETIMVNTDVKAHAASSLAEIHSGTALKMAQAAAVALSGFAAKPAPVESWQDAKTAYSIQRLACGIDKEGTQVSLNLAMFQQGNSEQDVGWESDDSQGESYSGQE